MADAGLDAEGWVGAHQLLFGLYLPLPGLKRSINIYRGGE